MSDTAPPEDPAPDVVPADPAASIDALRAALAEDPADVASRMELSEALIEADDAAGAVRELRLAFAALHGDPAAPALDRRQAQAALALAEALAATKDGDPGPLLARLRAGHGPLAAAARLETRQALKAGAADEARHACELALALAPDSADAHLLAAELAAGEAPVDRQVAHLAAAAGLAPDDAALRLRLGQRFRALGRPAAAAAALRAALRLDDTLYEAWRNLAAILRDDGQFAAALPLARHLIALREDLPDGHILLGQILTGLDTPAEAIAAYRRALDLDDDLIGPRRLLAEALTRLGDDEAALEAWREVARRDPTHGRTLLELGKAFTRLGRHAEAVAWYRRAVARRPDDDALNRLLVDALLRREQWAAALPLLAAIMPRRVAMDLPPWEGEPTARVVLRHRTADGLEALLLGLGLAAHAGLDAICLVPRAVVDLARHALPDAKVFVREEVTDAADLVRRNGATAQIRFRDLPWIIRGKRGACALPSWLAGPTLPDRRWAVVRTSGEGAPPPIMFEGLAEALGPEAFVVDGDQSPDALARALNGVGAALTGDGPAAHVIGAMGIPGIVLLPPDAPWWWGDRAGDAVWYPRLNLVRAPRPGAWKETLEQILTLAVPGAEAPAASPPPRTTHEDQDLREALDRVAPLLGRSSSAMTCDAMTGGTRNRVFRVDAPVGGRVLRLGKFPPRQRDYYVEEFHNMRRAAEAGLAPALHYGDDLDGTMLIDFVDAPALRYRDMRDRDTALTAARLYRDLHGLGGFRGRHSAFGNINRLTQRLGRAEDTRFAAQASLQETMKDLQEVLEANGIARRSCHNDPLAANFLGSAGHMVLVDWQMSAMSDPHWEVAALAAQSDMPDAVRDAYYLAYLGREDHPYWPRLLLYEVVCSWYWWLRALEDLLDDPESEEYLGDESRWWGRLNRRLESDWFGRSVTAMRRFRDRGKAQA